VAHPLAIRTRARCGCTLENHEPVTNRPVGNKHFVERAPGLAILRLPRRTRILSPVPPVTELPAMLHFLSYQLQFVTDICDMRGPEDDEVSPG
jgi:hypothetical protein